MKRLVLGCGYLGLRVAKSWVGTGDEVFAVSRSTTRFEQFKREGLLPIVADVTQPQTIKTLPTVDTVLFAVGFDRARYDDIRDVYVHGLKNVLDGLPNDVGHFIYISSTGVYGQSDGQAVDESSKTEPTRPGGMACLEAEQLLKQSRFADRVTILRFAGIYGRDRVPGKAQIESGDWNKISREGMLNLIHVSDGAHAVCEAARKRLFDTFIVSDGNPVLRTDYYGYLAEQLSAGPLPKANESSAKGDAEGDADEKIKRRSNGLGKRLSNAKIVKQLSFEFQYPDYRAGIAEALGQD